MAVDQSTQEKKKAKKKKHVSKHVLQAQEDMRKQKETLAARTASTEADSGKKKKKKRKAIVKDPNEVAEYLRLWKEDRDSWKFNKNTQSWLIRHAYEADKIHKGTFSILLEYLQGLQGDTMKQRILVDAANRALRYREHEKEKEPQGSKTEDGEKKSDEHKTESTDEEQKEEADRWNKLNDHDKRKEYKRARKILETLKA